MRSHHWLRVLAPIMAQPSMYQSNNHFVADIVAQASPLTGLNATTDCSTLRQRCGGTVQPVVCAQRGDLLFWGSDHHPYHVAIYYGGGDYITWDTESQAVVTTQITKQNYPAFSLFVPEK